MSADRWVECPVCRVNHENYLKKQHESVRRAYGTVPPEEWIKLRDDLLESEKKLPDLTVSEYHDFYLDNDGDLSISYKCSCRVCGATGSYSHRVENFLELPEVYVGLHRQEGQDT